MRFQVPQFIETETRLVGPFTLKQFIYIALGAVIIFLMRYAFNSLFLWVLSSLPIAGAAFGLAFYQIDGVPLPQYLARAFSFMIGNKKFIYKKDEGKDDIDRFIQNR